MMRTTPLKEETLEAIVAAAERLLHRYGYRKMTMCDVAEEARLSRPTVYLYYANKEELALGVIDRLHRDLRRELQAIASSPERPEEMLRRMLVGRVLFIYDRVPHDAQCLNDMFASIRPALLERRERCMALEAQDVSAVLEEGQSHEVFARDDPEATARVLITATNSLMPFGLSPRELGQRDELAARAARLADLLLKGLLAR